MSRAAVSSASKQRVRGAKAKQPLGLVTPAPAPRRLPRLQPVEGQRVVLRPSPIAEAVEEEVSSVNLLAGCPHQCPFCYARAYPNDPGDELVYFYRHTADCLREELRERKKLPRAVYLCPSTDPFPPYAEVQAEACRVLEVLAEFGVEAWFMTRGFIRPAALDVLARHRDLVRVTVSVLTMDSALRRVLEPLAAPTRMRIKQAARLRRLGIATQVAVGPLLPGLTDTRENIETLLDALAQAGIDHVTASYLYLRQGIQDNLARGLGGLGGAEPILTEYANGPVLPMGTIAPARHLPRSYRQRGYALLMALAAARGMTVSICGLTNPDFKPARPPAHRSEPPLRQLVLKYKPDEA